jgi:putative FmdB family regulatory protein
MPLYQLYCSKCLELHEVQVKLKDFDKLNTPGQKPKCPVCNTELTRMMSPVTFKFK